MGVPLERGVPMQMLGLYNRAMGRFFSRVWRDLSANEVIQKWQVGKRLWDFPRKWAHILGRLDFAMGVSSRS